MTTLTQVFFDKLWIEILLINIDLLKTFKEKNKDISIFRWFDDIIPYVTVNVIKKKRNVHMIIEREKLRTQLFISDKITPIELISKLTLTELRLTLNYNPYYPYVSNILSYNSCCEIHKRGPFSDKLLNPMVYLYNFLWKLLSTSGYVTIKNLELELEKVIGSPKYTSFQLSHIHLIKEPHGYNVLDNHPYQNMTLINFFKGESILTRQTLEAPFELRQEFEYFSNGIGYLASKGYFRLKDQIEGILFCSYYNILCAENESTTKVVNKKLKLIN